MNEADESTEEALFRKHMFCVVLDNVIREHTVRFGAVKQISDTFSFLWNYQKLSKKELKRKTAKRAEKYSKDISTKEDFVQKMNHITTIHKANYGRKQLRAFEPLNALAEYRLEVYFPTSVTV